MKLDKVANSGNDEFYTPYYAIEPLLKYIGCHCHNHQKENDYAKECSLQKM